MAIEIKGKIYRNLEEQVLKNKEDIASLTGVGGSVVYTEEPSSGNVVNDLEIVGGPKFLVVHVYTKDIAKAGTYILGTFAGLDNEEAVNCYIEGFDKGLLIIRDNKLELVVRNDNTTEFSVSLVYSKGIANI